MMKLITFDMYTTILDLFGSAVPLVQEVLNLSTEESEKFFRLWRTSQSQHILLNSCINAGHESFTYITKASLDYTSRKLNLNLNDDIKAYLVDHVWKNLKAWPDVKPVTEQLKSAGYKIAMLSNGDYEMLSPLQEVNNIRFDYIFSSNLARSHKPCPAIYNLPLIELGIGRQDTLHIPGGSVDVMGIKAAGFKCVWCNRFGDYTIDPCYQPDYIIKSLRELPLLLKNFF